MSIISNPTWNQLINKICVIDDYKTYQEALELFYKEFAQDMLQHDMICDFISIYNLNIKFGITAYDVKVDLQRIQNNKKGQEKIQKIETRLDIIKNEIPIIDSNQSYMDALKLLYPQVTTGLNGEIL